MRERGTSLAVRAATVLLSATVLVLGSALPSSAAGKADLALRSYAVREVKLGDTVTMKLGVIDFGPDAPASTARLILQAPRGTRIVRGSVDHGGGACEINSTDTRVVCTLTRTQQWKDVQPGGPMVWGTFQLLVVGKIGSVGSAVVSCACDPYTRNNRTALVLNGNNPPAPKPGPQTSPTPSKSAEPSASPSAEPTEPSPAVPTEAEVPATDASAPDEDGSGVDLLFVIGGLAVAVALAGLGYAVYLWRNSDEEEDEG
ncbi:hypothetical protein QEZ54_13000 [Catellatospora sp. KI3]|uniref:hypothetical protein n=1 Tax=Catellatospora sp. KI3 TaxID=3041620 RepID=UPI002482A4E4|nr:hypothetical protein [Catellatospora sp. KI3]MDI1461890.1 hypothetical protein [Catellatospora sp. KI3]